MLQIALGILLQLALFSLAAAAPLSTESHGYRWHYGAGGGVVGFIVLILDIIVFSTFHKQSSTLQLSTSIVVIT